MTKLFISFMTLASRVSKGQVTDADLDCGLFYLGCARGEALVTWEGSSLVALWLAREDPETRRQTHGKVVNALRKADAEGRVTWRTQRTCQTYEALNELLDRNGVGKIPTEYTDDDDTYHPAVPFSCPGVAVRVKMAGLDLDVVY